MSGNKVELKGIERTIDDLKKVMTNHFNEENRSGGDKLYMHSNTCNTLRNIDVIIRSYDDSWNYPSKPLHWINADVREE